MSTLSLRSNGANAYGSGTGSRFTGIFGAILAEMRARRAARQVESMSDEMLRDIGVSRSNIDQAVRSGRSWA